MLLEVRTKHGAMPRLPSNVVGSIRVKTRHLGHTKKLFAIGTKTARDQQITVDGERLSVEKYFKQSKLILSVAAARINEIMLRT